MISRAQHPLIWFNFINFTSIVFWSFSVCANIVKFSWDSLIEFKLSQSSPLNFSLCLRGHVFLFFFYPEMTNSRKQREGFFFFISELENVQRFHSTPCSFRASNIPLCPSFMPSVSLWSFWTLPVSVLPTIFFLYVLTHVLPCPPPNQLLPSVASSP